MKKDVRRLKVWRAERGVTQNKLARKAGMHALRYWKIENGELEPDEDEKKAVAAALNVKVSDIEWPSFAEVRA